MSHTLISTIVMGLVLAFALGAAAHRLKLSPIVGYLLAGVVIGPFTPGYVADQDLALQLAELGVILLMFGVGLHFSIKDLLSVKTIAIPGAIAQIALATLLGMGLAHLMGWSVGGGLVFGLSLSVASTVVLLRALQEHNLVETEQGRIAVGWLIVEDLVMVLALVLLPALATSMGEGGEPSSPLSTLEALMMTFFKLTAFGAMIMLVGRRVIPRVLHSVAKTGSRELFRLSVLAIALGVAYGSADLFGVSFALGAFFAGMILAESPLSHQAAEETLPLRDAFAVLFFVSVGMLFNPAILVTQPWPVLATFLIIVVGKSLAAYLIMHTSKYEHSTSLTISASLAQIGEFSFILAALGVTLGVLPEEGRDLILAGAILSIMTNPFLFSMMGKIKPWPSAFAYVGATSSAPLASVPNLNDSSFKRHGVILGYDTYGKLLAKQLTARGIPFYVVESRRENLTSLERFIQKNAARDMIAYGPLEQANLTEAAWMVMTIANTDKITRAVQAAHLANPRLKLILWAPDADAAAQDQLEHAHVATINPDAPDALSALLDDILQDDFSQALKPPSVPA